jgi:lipopolysaccharide export system permease protein
MTAAAISHRRSAPHVLFVYLARAYFWRYAMLLIGITVVLQSLDLLANSDDILAPHGAGIDSILKYTSLRIPQILSLLAPFIGLLASLITFATLNQHSEVTIMKAAGLSAFHIIAPLVFVSGFVAVGHFAMNETILVNANNELAYWQDNNYALQLPERPENATNVWATDGDAYVGVRGVTKSGTILDDVTIYHTNKDGALTEMTTAKFAAYVNNAWTLFDVTDFTVADHSQQTSSIEAWNTTLPPDRFLALSVEPDKVSFLTLVSTVNELKEEGHGVTLLTAWIYQKIANPLSILLMPLLGSLVGFGIYRSGHLFIRFIGGLALGFSYFVGDNLMLALGQFGTVPPLLAVWSPFILFLFLGLGIVIYTEE